MKNNSIIEFRKNYVLLTILGLGCLFSFALVRHTLRTVQANREALTMNPAVKRLPLMAGGGASGPDSTTQLRASEAYGKLPLSFQANSGQTDSQVEFLAHGSGYTVYLTGGEAVMRLRKEKSTANNPQSSVLRMQLAGGNPQPKVKGSEELPGKANYFIGNDPKKWRTGVPAYARVEYQEVYPGVSLVYYGNQRQLEYDFVVSPGAVPKTIELTFEGADKLSIDAQGNLVAKLDDAEVIQHAPVIYQEIDGVRRMVPGRYELRDERRVGFEVGPYDATKTLVIDPTLEYATYLGGEGFDWAWASVVDTQGFVYVTGSTGSINFPTTAGAFNTTFSGNSDVFISKLNPQGDTLIYSTFLGGGGDERGLGIALDATSALAYVTGWTTSNNFPTTAGAYDTTHNGGSDVFVTKLNAAGTMLGYSTLLGGAGDEVADGLEVNSQGIAYVAGYTNSTQFPTTSGAFDTTHNGGQDGFVTKLNAAGSNLVYSTFIGEEGDDYIGDLALEGDFAYVTGWTWSTRFPTTSGAYDTTHNGGSDAFVTKLNATGRALVYSTLLGGSDNDFGRGIFVSGGGIASITGSAVSANFPTTAGAYDTALNGGAYGDAFVARLNGNGASLTYSTYLGGNENESGQDILVDSAGFTYVVGVTNSPNFPRLNQLPNQVGGMYDAFVTKFNGQGNALIFSTILGGSNNDAGIGIGIDGAGLLYVAGYSWSNNFHTTAHAYDRTFNGGGSDAVVFKLQNF